MMRKVSLYLVSFLVFLLLLGLCGCVEEGGNAHQTSAEPGLEPVEGELTGLRPEKHWEGTWKIKEKESTLETDGDQIILDAYCLIEYEGKDPATDVQVSIQSPLSEGLIGDSSVENFGSVNPGEVIEYRVSLTYPFWQETLSAGCSEDNFIEDYTMNSYVELSWSSGSRRHGVQFFDWSAEFPTH
ncbi:MAG: hypothetical protein GX989_01255 [Firmicutes bacterium]|nr:hypothetical protein [Bacillota bacterium]